MVKALSDPILIDCPEDEEKDDLEEGELSDETNSDEIDNE